MSYLSQFFHQISGPDEGRKWVFLHGLMGFSANWRRIISQLEASERCLVFDQRGHGRSVKPDRGYTPEDYAADLSRILDELQWQKIILVGHSMGGRNAMAFAAQYPEQVEKLIIEDISPELNPEGYKYYEYLLGLVPTPFVDRPSARSFFKEVFPKVAKTKENPIMIAEYFYANMVEQADGQVSWRFSPEAIIESAKAGRAQDRWEQWQSLSMPVLLIRGERSRDLSHDHFARMLELNSNVRGIEIANAGHWVHAEQPEAFAQELKKFVGGF